mmetsp:Transcript_56631/g.83121  ORF Transcript_56631/g.83121 Transcript_56631/m.83121 type:complete len:222 (+) Transcript_56631:105-770(+)
MKDTLHKKKQCDLMKGGSRMGQMGWGWEERDCWSWMWRDIQDASWMSCLWMLCLARWIACSWMPCLLPLCAPIVWGWGVVESWSGMWRDASWISCLWMPYPWMPCRTGMAKRKNWQWRDVRYVWCLTCMHLGRCKSCLARCIPCRCLPMSCLLTPCAPTMNKARPTPVWRGAVKWCKASHPKCPNYISVSWVGVGRFCRRWRGPRGSCVHCMCILGMQRTR